MSTLEAPLDRRDGARIDDLFDLDSPRSGFPIKRSVMVALLMALALGAAAYWWYTTQRAAPQPTYTTAPVVRGDVSVGASASGPLTAPTSVPLSFKTAGQVSQILVQVGQRVSRGQALAQLESSDLQRALATARANLDQQVGALAKLEQGPTPESIAAAQTQVQGGIANLAMAQAAAQAAHAAYDADTQLAATTVDGAQAAANDGAALLDASTAQTDSSHAADAQAVANAERNLADAAKSVDAARSQAAAIIGADQTTVANAQSTLDDARKSLVVAQQQLDTATSVDQAAVANAQAAAANAQKALQRAQQIAGASQGVQQAQIDKAQEDISAAEANRDAICGMSTATRAQCQPARSAVDQAQAALVVAQTSAKQTAAQNLQTVQTAQSELDQANGALRSAQATVGADRAHNQAPLQTAQAQVDSASGALQSARDVLAADEARQQAGLQTAQQQADQALGTLQSARSTAASDAAHDDVTLQQAQQTADQSASGLRTAQAQATQTATHSATTVQTAEQQAQQAAGQLGDLEAQLEQAAAQPTEADLAAARAQVAAAQVAVDQAEANLASATLEAPVDGTVAQISATLGQTVSTGASSAGSTSLLTIVDLDQLQVQAQVNESDMAGIKVGNAIAFTLSAYPGNTFSGRVVSIQPVGNQSQNVVTYTVVCSIDHTDTSLLPGMTASVTLVADSRSDVVLVPASALQFAQSQGNPPGSVVVMANGIPAQRPVQTGLSDGRLTEVLSGVQPGEIVVTGESGR